MTISTQYSCRNNKSVNFFAIIRQMHQSFGKVKALRLARSYKHVKHIYSDSVLCLMTNVQLFEYQANKFP